jgi:hypothetical protein
LSPSREVTVPPPVQEITGRGEARNADRLLAEYIPGQPRITDSPAAVCGNIPHVEVNNVD